MIVLNLVHGNKYRITLQVVATTEANVMTTKMMEFGTEESKHLLTSMYIIYWVALGSYRLNVAYRKSYSYEYFTITVLSYPEVLNEYIETLGLRICQ